MAFISFWLAMRYVSQSEARLKVRALTKAYYQGGDAGRAPAEQSQALYDLVFAAAELGRSAFDTLTVSAYSDHLLELFVLCCTSPVNHWIAARQWLRQALDLNQ